MLDSKRQSAGPGPFLPSALALLFIGLKLTGHIDWSWWWVTAPLWGGPAIMLATAACIFLAAGVIHVFERKGQ